MVFALHDITRGTFVIDKGLCHGQRAQNVSGGAATGAATLNACDVAAHNPQGNLPAGTRQNDLMIHRVASFHRLDWTVQFDLSSRNCYLSAREKS